MKVYGTHFLSCEANVSDVLVFVSAQRSLGARESGPGLFSLKHKGAVGPLHDGMFWSFQPSRTQ